MSAAQKLTKKQKKALAFRDRKGKGKAKTLEALQDVPIEEDQVLAETEAEDRPVEDQTRRAETPSKGASKVEPVVEDSKPARKRKRAEDEDAEGAKEKRSKKKPKSDKTVDAKTEDGEDEGEKDSGKTKNAVKQRYILFVGA